MVKNKHTNRFLGVFSIFREELKRIFKDEGILLFFILVPLVYPLLYSAMYTTEVVRELPVTVVDYSKTSLSREYIRKLDATPEVAIVEQSPDMQKAQELMAEEKVFGIVQIPREFSKDVVRAENQAYVGVFVNMASFFYYGAVLSANTEVALDMSRDIKLKRLTALSKRQENIEISPIRYEHICLFNTQNGFASAVIPAVLILILHQTLILGIGLLAGTERERNRFHDLIPAQKYYTEIFSLLTGKALAYFMVYLLNAVYVLWCVPYFFGFPQIGHWQDMLAFFVPFLLASIFFSMALSTFVRNRETVIVLFVFSSIPFLFLSGISWPSMAMPAFWRGFSYLFPSTLGAKGFLHLNTMGATLDQISFEYIGLWVQVGVYFLISFFAYQREILLSRKHIHKCFLELRAKH